MPKTKIQPEPEPKLSNVPDWILDMVARTIFEVGLTESLAAVGRDDFDRDPENPSEDWDTLPDSEKRKYHQIVWNSVMDGVTETEFANQLPNGTKSQRKIMERKVYRDLSVLRKVCDLLTTLRADAIAYGSRKA